MRGVDSDKLVKFWLAILWRFGISSLHEAEAIRLGPYEDRLRDILFSGVPCPDEPAVLMVRYRSKVMPPENICFPPYLSEFPGLSGGLRRRTYGIAVAGFHAFVKIDARPLPYPVPEITVNRKDIIQGGYLEFENTHQFRRLVEIANNMSLKPRRPGAQR
ncbi:MAG: hypothetical protein P4M00_02770 [Azospirillaceae bacterium]|nr:hypothetical protein [Azospirillaceae bacterium]